MLTMLTNAERPPQKSYNVVNFLEYRLLQVFCPTRGVLCSYDRATGHRHPLPGADAPEYLQTNGVWSPDGKYVAGSALQAHGHLDLATGVREGSGIQSTIC